MIQKGILVLLLIMVDPGDISKINTAKSEARKAYIAGDYKTAVEKYTYLVDSIGVNEDEVMMNLANSYFHLNDTAKAINSFQSLTVSKNPRLQSIANQQLGVLHNREGKFDQALAYFKQALKTNPANEDARFNYEMVKKKLEEEKKKEEQEKKQQEKNQDKKDQKDQQKDQQDQEQKDQEKKDQEKKEQEKKEQEDKKEQEEQEKKDQEQKEQEEKEKQDKDKKELPPSVREKLKEMDMSEEKAKMILDAMKNQEVQYLQQNKRKPTKQRDKSKPDW
jgi:tetratricopeptide (TPR) repeat protein